MWAYIVVALVVVYIAVVTWGSYKLGVAKTDNPKRAAMIGFFLSFLPPLALIYFLERR